MEGPLDPGPVVVAEGADVIDDVGDVGLADLALEEGHLAVRKARLRPAAEVEHDLDQGGLVGQGMNGVDDLRRQGRQEQVEVVHRFTVGVGGDCSHGTSGVGGAGTWTRVI